MEIGDELKTCRLQSYGLIYYTKKPYIESIQNKDRFLEVLHSSQRVYIVIYPHALDQFKREMGVELYPIDQGKVGHWHYVLISNR